MVRRIGTSGRICLGLLSAALLAANVAAVVLPARPLTDPQGDVSYSAAYPGPQDHDYLDVLGLDWEYDAPKDLVRFTLQGASYEAFAANAPADVDIVCGIRLDISLDGVAKGRLQLRLEGSEPGAPFVHRALLSGTGGSGGEAINAEHDFRGTYAAPGMIEFSVARALLANYGDSLGAPTVNCAEQYSPQRVWPEQPLPPNGGTLGNPIFNSDSAENATAEPLRLPAPPRGAGSDVDDDPLAGDEGRMEPSTKSPTPALAAAVATVAIAGAAIITRRTR